MSRPRCRRFLVPCVVSIVVAAGAGRRDGQLKVAAQIDAAKCYVGQAVEISVRIIAAKEPPVFEAVPVSNASIQYIGTELRPLPVSGIDNLIVARTEYRALFRLVPRHVGALTIPGFRVRVGDAKGVSPAIKLTVEPTPMAGRPAVFLGGVGPFAVTAEAELTTIRAGQEMEYRVTIRGPAALGVNGPPDLSRLERLPLGFRVERRPDVTSAEPPSHAFVFRLRPTRAGAATLPPVSVAAFDPKAEVYVTKTTAGITIRVIDVPRFDASTLVSPVERTEPARRSVWPFAVATAALVLSFGVVSTIRLRRRSRPARERGRTCRAAVARISRQTDAAAQGRALVEALADYLRLTVARPAGALTPTEARDGIARATGSDDLAARAEALIVRTDAIRFGACGDAPGDEGVAFFRDLERAGIVGPKTR